MSRSRIHLDVQSMAVGDAIAALERKTRGRKLPEAAEAPAPAKGKAVKSAPAKPGASGAGEIRIIGGQWRRTRLPVAQRPGLRPTPDRVRETLFNWLGQDLSGWRCMDGFAGTGALGFEAASRGAREVVMVELDAGLVAQLRSLQQRLGASAVKVQRGDALGALQQVAPGSFDLVLLDPPFAENALFLPALRAACSAVAANGWIYLEAPAEWDDVALAPLGLVRQRYLKAGAVHAHLLRKGDDPGA
ncbi:16S rRNA (guanine(966)-N(2))-methyltransferase RsmD [Comamonas endophytica]|uniref:16S rRNA (Guanine(966)-N(2))-methyltransferase RsmD n=1 Tax=Comamonas endophytica TaxID=2949090 RepID=A0ABY6G6Q9_9BURK|nr:MULTISPECIES: 16S rRNA (guanine(966)-N(2))-methyltransferase RsmD [unclassified Acidovorax]MCD2511330.1 16S rRNA (guanine(966)-N(2))-methyltransferase RsmD [Acidovorax sp. D4N7]UYG50724.1 16S rRNA (guanine(966)-N(2))-methyltransferase RsmD [Acidovorax sp. 5MLIR]